MNRPPQKADTWFSAHQESCGGTFIKVDGPEMNKNDNNNNEETNGKRSNKIKKPSEKDKTKALETFWSESDKIKGSSSGSSGSNSSSNSSSNIIDSTGNNINSINGM